MEAQTVFLESPGSASAGAIWANAHSSTPAPFARLKFAPAQNFNPGPRGWIGEWYTCPRRAGLWYNLHVISSRSTSFLFAICSMPCARNHAASLQAAHQCGRALSGSHSSVYYLQGNQVLSAGLKISHIHHWFCLWKSHCWHHRWENRQDTTMQSRLITGSAHWNSEVCLFPGHSQYPEDQNNKIRNDQYSI